VTKINMGGLLKNVKMALSDHSPEILTGLGIAGMITTTVLAVKATPKALDLISDAEYEKYDDEGNREPLTKIEVVKAAWKPYIPAAITCATSVACLIGAGSVNAKRNAALATAYNLASNALTEFKDATLETVGEKKNQTIKNKVAEKQIEKNPVNQSAIIVSGQGNTRCFDTITKQRFTSDIETIRRIVNDLNERMINGEDYISLNEFYYELGLDGTSIGEDLGWNIARGKIKVDFNAQLDSDGVPCIVIDYVVPPEYGYSRYR